MPYLGNEPAAAFTSTTKDSFSGDASTTDFTMSKSANVNAVRVVVENVVQDPSVAYTCSGTTLSFTSAPPTGTNNIYVVHLGPPAATVAPPTTINNSTTFGDGADIITASKGTDNIRLGEGAGAAIVSGGNNNVAIGKDAGLAISTGDNNVAVGFEALKTEDGHGNNIALGYQALKVQNAGANANNVAVGYQAGVATTTGSNNILIGALAGDAITDGNTNVAVGSETLSTNVQGDRNVAVGHKALETLNPAGDVDTYNTAVGFKAGNAVTTGVENVFVGGESGDAVTTGSRNTFVGYNSGGAATTGTYNAFLGRSSGSAMTTGGKNSIIGSYNGNQNGLDIRSSSNNIVLSDGDGNYHIHIDSSGTKVMRGSGVTGAQIGNGTSSGSYFGNAGDFYSSRATSSTSIHARFYNTNGQIGRIETSGTSTAFVTSSDYRLKENVTYDWDATTRLKQLKPSRFNFIADADTTVDGFLAHEVETVVPEAVSGVKDGLQVWNEADELPKDKDGNPTVSVGDNKLDADGNTMPEYQGIDQSKLVPLLVKTIQELEARITALENA